MAQLICGNTERVKDVVMASRDDHGDEDEADLGHSMELPGRGGMPGVKCPREGARPNCQGKGAHQTYLG